MQELEKILEEIKAHAIEFEVFGTSDDYISVGWAKDIICKHMKNEEDILKFYYCESEDDYYLGQRVQNMYYARYADRVFTWFMSRHLPWGKRVTAPETTWKEYTYPTEPKEIPFTEWLDGFIRKHMNDGWIPVEERMPEEYGEYLVTIVPSAGYLWAKRIIANFSDLMGIVKKPIFYTGEVGKIDFEDITDMVIAWRPLPEPYSPERSEVE